MKNAITVDVEDWYQTQDFNFNPDTWDTYESRIENNTKRVLNVLSENNVKATFFVLGYIAQKNPELIKEIAAAGHEIGSHGNNHRMLHTLSSKEFRKDLVTSKKILEDVIGKSVQMFRAPTWSMGEKTLWALEMLEEEGFVCDSSMQPFKTPLSGMNGIPTSPFYPVLGTTKLNMLEFPSTTLHLGKLHLPFAGGLYLRTFPYWFVQLALKIINRKDHGMIYVHPWEFDVEQPRLKMPFHIKCCHYMNLNTTERKLDALLKNFEFAPLGEVIKDGNYPSVSLI